MEKKKLMLRFKKKKKIIFNIDVIHPVLMGCQVFTMALTKKKKSVKLES